MEFSQRDLAELTAEIVAAYVSNNSVASADLPRIIRDVNVALVKTSAEGAEPEPEQQQPAVAIRKSITPDAIVCLECGKKFKSLKRHIRTDHDMTPEEYRGKWTLKSDYPMVAPNYAKARSDLAKTMGLGRKAVNATGEGSGSADRSSSSDAASSGAKRGRGRTRKTENA